MAELLGDKLATILVVDDTEVILQVVSSILRTANYAVLQAGSGPDALRVARDYPGTIDLLLSDVQMPGMNGPALGESLKKSRPHMHVMLMSSFSGGDLLVLNYGWAFIEKPFVPVKLLEMVNDVLHSP